MGIKLIIIKMNKNEFIRLRNFGSGVAFEQPEPRSDKTTHSNETTYLYIVRMCHVGHHNLNNLKLPLERETHRLNKNVLHVK